MKNRLCVVICRIMVLAVAVSLLSGGTALAQQRVMESKVNINEAAVKVLAKLPGIGKKKAEAIVAYRNENGKFRSVDDIQKVEGIGKKIFEKVKDHVTVDGSS